MRWIVDRGPNSLHLLYSGTMGGVAESRNGVQVRHLLPLLDMSGFPPAGYRLMIVDDDEMVRRGAGAAGDDGWGSRWKDVRVGSGGAGEPGALKMGSCRKRVLADMQMPGPSGVYVCAGWRGRRAGEGTVDAGDERESRDWRRSSSVGTTRFLRKPFSMEQMCDALAGAARAKSDVERAEVLRAAVVEQLQETMGTAKLRELYRVFLADAEVRLATLRRAAEAHDDGVWREAAHQLKGSCGMVGAAELAGLVGGWEARGLPGVGEVDPFEEVEAALARLRRVLEARLH